MSVVLQKFKVSGKKPDSISGDGRRFHMLSFFTSEEKVTLEVSLVKPSVYQRCRSVFIVSLVLSQTDEVHWAKIKPVLFHPWPFLTHVSLLGAMQKHTQVFRPVTQIVSRRINSSLKGAGFHISLIRQTHIGVPPSKVKNSADFLQISYFILIFLISAM